MYCDITDNKARYLHTSRGTVSSTRQGSAGPATPEPRSTPMCRSFEVALGRYRSFLPFDRLPVLVTEFENIAKGISVLCFAGNEHETTSNYVITLNKTVSSSTIFLLIKYIFQNRFVCDG